MTESPANPTALHHSAWLESRKRFTHQLPAIAPQQLGLRLAPESNTVGWLLRHIPEVELMFARNVFGDDQAKAQELRVYTLGLHGSPAHWSHLPDLLDLVQQAETKLGSAILNLPPDGWHQPVEIKGVGTYTRAEALARIATHTAYHAGQLALALKYGHTAD